MWFIDLIDHLAPTIGVGMTGFFGYLAARSSNLSKQQVMEIKDELQGIKDDVGGVKEDVGEVKDLGTDNKGQIAVISDKLTTHEEAHLVQMRLRLERELSRAIKLGYTTRNDFAILSDMFKSYKELGGNGYVERLFGEYDDLPLKEKKDD